ncbi:hypothetical protein ACFW6K_09895 [Streptomyces sp. NPDC058733]|uniref:hypothetical protein n=1 Tax=unclassified Streptomyces TaxID=2593676 RepID=UPI00365BA8A7
MQQWGRGIKLTAVCGLVVLALTGFSDGGHRGSSGSSSGGSGKVSKSGSGKSRSGSGSRHSSGGGGCSSSSQDHDDYDDDDDTAYDDTSGDDTPVGDDATMMPPRDGIVTLVSCATKKQPYATVQVHNPNDQDGTFSFRIRFLDAKGRLVHVQLDQLDVPANRTVTAKEYVGAGDAGKVRRCDPDALADVVTPTPSATP